MPDWRDHDTWKALVDGVVYDDRGTPVELRTFDCGELLVPVGRLLICDPYVVDIFWSEHVEVADRLHPDSLPPLLPIAPGRYPVKITIADVSGELDWSHPRNAYITLFLSQADEVRRAPLPIYTGWSDRLGIGVDCGTVCLVDLGVLTPSVLAQIEEEEEPYWDDCLEEEDHIAYGVANLDLPGLVGKANMIVLTSGWGDGFYPIVGGYDASGKLVRVHVDFCLSTHWAGQRCPQVEDEEPPDERAFE
jgi:hypothetical protein